MPHNLVLNHVVFLASQFPRMRRVPQYVTHVLQSFCDITMTLVTGSVALAKLWSGNKFCGLLIIFHIS